MAYVLQKTVGMCELLSALKPIWWMIDQCISSSFAMIPVGLFLLLTVGPGAQARDAATRMLQEQKKLGIPFDQCEAIENKLGQLMYVNVDGYGTGDRVAIAPAYLEMVNDLQIGGVLPKPGNANLFKIQASMHALRSSTKLPLLLGIDYNEVAEGEIQTQFGLGYGGGFMMAAGGLSDECLSAVAYLDAFLHRGEGLNQSLGPTIERSARYGGFLNQDPEIVATKVRIVTDQFRALGMVTTLKHYPFTPRSYNLHVKSEDTRLPLETVSERLQIFKKLAGESDFVMSTHLYDSMVDPDNMATFSPKWIRKLRDDLGYKGLLISDALFMFQRYPATVKHMAAKWPQDQVFITNEYSIFAARSILAGHDMVLLEGDRNETYGIFNDLVKIACQKTPISETFRSRVNESFTRISQWKSYHKSELEQEPEIPSELYGEALAIYKDMDDRSPEDTMVCPDLKRFAQFEAKASTLNLYPINATPPAIFSPAPAKGSTTPANQ